MPSQSRPRSPTPAIVWLGEQRQHCARLAEWHVRAFGRWIPGWSIEQAAAELAAQTQQRGFPTTLVALEGSELLGSVSLLDADPPAPERYAPFLGSLFVLPEARGRGIGAALVTAAVDEARRLGLPTLHLWTPGHAEFYRRLGWRSLGEQRFAALVATLMCRDCA